jgi:hypothetical protein
VYITPEWDPRAESPSKVSEQGKKGRKDTRTEVLLGTRACCLSRFDYLYTVVTCTEHKLKYFVEMGSCMLLGRRCALARQVLRHLESEPGKECLYFCSDYIERFPVRGQASL